MVVKLRPSAADVHAHALRSGAYHREIGAYREVSGRQACRIPQCYWVAGDETNINLVMEDLTQTTTPGDQVAGCGVAETESVVTELARLHSSFYPLTDDTAPSWLIRMSEVSGYWSDAAERGTPAVLTRFAEDLPPDFLATIADGAALVRTWYALPQQHLTLTHGDPRVDNVLFENSDAGVSAVLLDWQVTGLRNPMYDFGYFMSGSVDVTERRLHETRLLKRYIEVFAEKSSGYDEHQATADYRIQLLSGLYVTLAAVAVLPDNDVVNRLILALLQRNCAAAADWNSIEALRDLTASRH
ncbi:phosphotransferase family protein [Rhodococcus sp. NPDC127530]|uniref:phosphotransferase family protein n=1 Tax=unclassified Rhodococcus (in: high G+C Gram-positive bacteria) TaxID=192944 RepID=UPI00362EFD80